MYLIGGQNFESKIRQKEGDIIRPYYSDKQNTFARDAWALCVIILRGLCKGSLDTYFQSGHFQTPQEVHKFILQNKASVIPLAIHNPLERVFNSQDELVLLNSLEQLELYFAQVIA